MSNLIEFRLGNGEPLFLDPSFIREISGGIAGTTVTVERKDSKGDYITYQIPLPVKQFCQILRTSQAPNQE